VKRRRHCRVSCEVGMVAAESSGQIAVMLIGLRTEENAESS